MLGLYPISGAPISSAGETGEAGPVTVFATVAATLPKLTASSLLVHGAVTVVTLPKLTGTLLLVSNVGIRATLPKMTAVMSGYHGIIANASGTLPKLSGALTGGPQSFAVTLPKLTASMTGVIGRVGTLAATLPKLSMSSTLQNVGGGITANLPKLTMSATAIAGVSANLTKTLPKLTMQSAALLGVNGSINATLPKLTGSLQLLAVSYGTISATLPRITGAFTVVLDNVQMLVHVMNTVNSAVTTFDEYPFNSFAEFGGSYLAAGPNGLVKLDVGMKDDLANVDANFATGQLYFGTSLQKRMTDFYFGARADGPVTLTVTVDENEPLEYTLDPLDIATINQRRSLIGKGARGKYWQYGFENVDGSYFEFDSMDMTVVPVDRRI